MQIKFSQLSDILRKKSITAILISGDEPYQHMLATDKVRQRANELGFTERKIISVESGFDWSELEIANCNMSLFGNRILIDLRIPTGKPGAAGSKAIVKLLDNINQDVMLLVQVPKLDRSSISSAWVNAINKSGYILRIWPLSEAETKSWIKKKLLSNDYSASNEIVDLIFQHVEGNLLAAMQEIEKISLQCDNKVLEAQSLQKALVNSCHFSLNQLIDAVQSKNTLRAIRIINTFQKRRFCVTTNSVGIN